MNTCSVINENYSKGSMIFNKIKINCPICNTFYETLPSVEVIIVSWQTPLSQIILKWLGKHSWEIFRIIIVHMILALIWVIDYIWFQFINGFQECYKAISSVEMYILQHESCYNGRVVWIYREPNFEASSGTTCCT